MELSQKQNYYDTHYPLCELYCEGNDLSLEQWTALMQLRRRTKNQHECVRLLIKIFGCSVSMRPHYGK